MVKQNPSRSEQEDFNKDNGSKEGVRLGSAFDFLFEGENREYDKEYEDYI